MISQDEYQARRAKLIEKIGKDAIAIIPSAKEVIRNGDTTYAFRQNSDFYYLTGFDEPDAVIVLDGSTGEFILFCRAKDPTKEIWNGKMAGLEGAQSQFRADKAYDIKQVDTLLASLLKGHALVYDEKNSIQPILSEMRLRKSSSEIALMQQAADISVKAHEKAMRACKPGMYEYELEAELLHTFYQQGCRYVAYPPIVGSGENACTLHYHQNEAKIQKGDLVLIDAGGEYQNYSSDITRTFPVNGKFNPGQKAIYNLVLQAQLAAIALIKPGLQWNKIQEKIHEVFIAGLTDLGLLQQGDDIKKFYMHGSGHWLGLDTHDVGSYKINDEWRELEPGFVLTVEPGIYIPANTPGVDKKWWNIGVRIEDDVVVTKEGHHILTGHLIKKVDDIEALMAG